MNAPQNRAAFERITAWHNNSGIIECCECEGHGTQPNKPWLRNGDPDCWDVECPECEGHGHHACKVCGFDIEVPGFDCLVCDMALEVPAKLMTDKTAVAMGEALRHAFAAALALQVSA